VPFPRVRSPEPQLEINNHGIELSLVQQDQRRRDLFVAAIAYAFPVTLGKRKSSRTRSGDGQPRMRTCKVFANRGDRKDVARQPIKLFVLDSVSETRWMSEIKWLGVGNCIQNPLDR
jgi:hypothetical protein